MAMLCPEIGIGPAVKPDVRSGLARIPSGPKNRRHSPVKEKCAPTAAISSTRTEASDSGWKATR
jgi:hypothetical protein